MVKKSVSFFCVLKFKDKSLKKQIEFNLDNVPQGLDISPLIIKEFVKYFFKIDLRSRKLNNKLIHYNTEISVKIYNEESILIDTESNICEIHKKRLKFNSSKSSKDKFLKYLLYLNRVQSYSMLDLEGFSDIENKDISRLIHNSASEKGFSIRKLTDFQLAFLCQGMIESRPRILSNRFFESQYFSVDDRNEAIDFVKVAWYKYGQEIIYKCLNLNQKPFHIKSSRLAFIKSISNPNKDYSYSLYNRYLGKEIEIKSRFDKGYSFNDSKGNEILRINKDGQIKVDYHSKRITATLAFFMDFCGDPIREIIFFGSEKGKCSFCKKELTDPISINLGYGKVCAKNNGLDFCI